MDNRFDGFAVNLYIDDDGDWMAHFAERPEISAFGDTPESALSELATAWASAKEVYAEKGLPVPVAPVNKSYSGSFNVRVNRDLHRALAIEAARQGVSLNAIVAKKLAETTHSF